MNVSLSALAVTCLPLAYQGSTAQEEDAPPARFEGSAATNFIQWSADESTLLAGSPNGDMLLFEAATGKVTQRIAGGDSFSAFATFLPGDKLIAASDYAGRLSIYDRAKGTVLARERGHSAEIAGAACSPDGTLLATSDKDGDAVIWEWNGKDLSIRHRLTNAVDDFANQICFSPDGQRIAVCGSASRSDRTGEAAVFEVVSGKRTFRVVTAAFTNAAEFSQAGDTLYVGTSTGKIRGYDLASGGPAAEPGGVGPQGIARAQVVANDIALYYDDSGPAGAFAAGGDGLLRRVSFDGQTAWSERADRSACYFASVSPSGQLIATSGTEGALRIFSSDGKKLRTIGGAQ